MFNYLSVAISVYTLGTQLYLRRVGIVENSRQVHLTLRQFIACGDSSREEQNLSRVTRRAFKASYEHLQF